MNMSFRDQIVHDVLKACQHLNAVSGVDPETINLEHPSVESFGDYSTSIALKAYTKFDCKNPAEFAQKLVEKLSTLVDGKLPEYLEKIEIAGPGFINFFIKQEFLVEEMGKIGHDYGKNNHLEGKKIMVEFAHPNTHKQFHIGHLRNIVLGESVVRLLEQNSAKVIRANYQGDVGMHVAKALYGISQTENEYSDARALDIRGRVEFLGKAYVLGSKSFEENEDSKAEITALNKKIYLKDPQIFPLWQETRQWSLDYFDLIYQRVDSTFDRFYFESEVAEKGKETVLANVGKVFRESDGAIIFPGEEFGLHNRVFINSQGNPTYEGKDVGLSELQFKEYNPDLIIHNVGPEQTGYFEVLFEALAQVFPQTKGREKHLAYGWVKLKEGKMSSRIGNVVLGEWLLDTVKATLAEKYQDKITDLEPVAIAAVKYSLLKVGTAQEIAFDINESISLEGDSGPYLLYTYARGRSVLRKAQEQNFQFSISNFQSISNFKFQISNLTQEESVLLHYLYRFPEVVELCAKTYSPNHICAYLFELAKKFNVFYNNIQILAENGQGSADSSFRLSLTEATTMVLQNGLNLLGIKALEKM